MVMKSHEGFIGPVRALKNTIQTRNIYEAKKL